jgi:alanyl-tRNA synthetase
VRLLAILKDGRRVPEARAGERVELVFDRTPFYGEGGGQLGDRGELAGAAADAEITDTVIPVKGLFVHAATVRRGRLAEGERCRAAVNPVARQAASSHHTGTLILHATLREVLGDHVKQAGSLVAPDRLRFDYHFAPLSPRELAAGGGDREPPHPAGLSRRKSMDGSAGGAGERGAGVLRR